MEGSGWWWLEEANHWGLPDSGGWGGVGDINPESQVFCKPFCFKPFPNLPFLLQSSEDHRVLCCHTLPASSRSWEVPGQTPLGWPLAS